MKKELEKVKAQLADGFWFMYVEIDGITFYSKDEDYDAAYRDLMIKTGCWRVFY